MAGGAVAARDDVLGIVAHDLRNPLSVIMMAANAMRRRPGNEPDRRDGETPEVILRAAKRMNQLIEDLLDVARVEAGQLRVAFALLLAADLARDAVEMQKPLAAASGVTISLDVDPAVRLDHAGQAGHVVDADAVGPLARGDLDLEPCAGALGG